MNKERERERETCIYIKRKREREIHTYIHTQRERERERNKEVKKMLEETKFGDKKTTPFNKLIIKIENIISIK